MSTVDLRGSASNELRITLLEPLERALLADWRKRPIHRFLMRLPWSMAAKTSYASRSTFLTALPAKSTHNFTRMMRFYRR